MASTRRSFVRLLAAQTALLVVRVPRESSAQPSGPFAPNQWLTIDAAGRVTLMLDKSEMGQGVSTAVPMILADELGADWRLVHIVQARPGPRFDNMGTSGSSSVTDTWQAPRRAAAAARTMLIAAAAARWRVPAGECTTENGFVRHGPSSRRAPFGTLVPAASRLPVPEQPAFRDPASYTIIGTRVTDPAVPRIVRGREVFGIDVKRPGMLYATIARPTSHGARLRRFDATEALRITGVRQVEALAGGVAVIATSSWAALKARRVLRVEWEPGPNATFDTAQGWDRLTSALRTGGKPARTVGDTATAFAAAHRRFSAEYRWPWQAHAPIEPPNCVADARNGRCEVWVGTQNANHAQQEIARALGMSPAQVTVNVLRLGGGFGRRIPADYAVEAALVSRAMAAPVQVLWTREDDLQHDFYNPAQINRLEASVDDAGRVTGWLHQVADFNLTFYGAFDPNYNPAEGGDPWGGFDTPYAVPNLKVELALSPSPVPTGAWRAVSYPASVLARETFLDDIAHQTGQDPVGLRLSLIPSPGAVTRGGVSIPNGDRLRHVLQEAAERGGLGDKPAPAADGSRVGRGIACNAYHNGTMVAQVADVSVSDRGRIRVRRIVSVVDGGLIINPLGVEKQFEGGIGWALSALFGPGVEFAGGGTVTGSFSEYPILRFAEMPKVETHMVESRHRPFGMGEQSVPAVAPAVLNAVFAATGHRVRVLPLQDADLVRRG